MRLQSLKFCSHLASVPMLRFSSSKTHESALPPFPAACSSAVRSCFETFLRKQEGWKLLFQEWKLRFVFGLFVPSWDSNTSFTSVICWISQENWQLWGVFLCWFVVAVVLFCFGVCVCGGGIESTLYPRIWVLVGLKLRVPHLKLFLLWNIFWKGKNWIASKWHSTVPWTESSNLPRTF